jgi:hypothetical protein
VALSVPESTRMLLSSCRGRPHVPAAHTQAHRYKHVRTHAHTHISPPPMPVAGVQLAHVALSSLASMGVRPPLRWMRAYERHLASHIGRMEPKLIAQVVWAYGHLVPPPPYAKMYYRPPRELLKLLLRCGSVA